MAENQNGELQDFLNSNIQRLNQTIEQENAERQGIKARLRDFHEAVRTRNDEITCTLERVHTQRMTALSEQTTKITDALRNHDTATLEDILRRIRD